MHKRNARGRGAGYMLTCLLLFGIPLRASAQVTATVDTPGYLGDWLSRHYPGSTLANDNPAAVETHQELYTRALLWARPLDKKIQDAQRNSLLTQIRYLPTKERVSREDREGLYTLVASRPATGRVTVKSGDARWLQANPPSDPMLEIGDTITIPLRPTTVTLIRENGSLCIIPFKEDAEASYYTKVCSPAAVTDLAWVAQPNGVVEKVKVGLWNRASQPPVAPGAWIWAPDRRSGWSEDLSDRLAEFFSTQLPSGIGSDDGAQTVPNVSGPALESANSWARYRSRDLQITTNDWGNEGLLQTPSARMGAAGEASISITGVNPYTRLNVMLHPLDWFEFGFRYTDISNHPYGSLALSGTQSYKDKSIDAKVRLIEESTFIPQVAMGLMDIGGTGIFSSEYFVASKRTGGFDWSLGLGWGYLGRRGDFENPLSVFSDKFRTRPNGSGSSAAQAGGVGKSYFRGPIGIFGGVQYQLSSVPLVFKLEYDGNDYKHDPFNYNAHARLPINLGVVYRVNRNIDVSAGFERGNRAMLGVALHGNLSEIGRQKVNDPQPLAISVARPAVNSTPTDWSKTATDLNAQTRWPVRNISQSDSTLIVAFDSPDAFYRKDMLDRIATVLHRDAPANIDTFKVVTVVQGQAMRAYIIRRSAWVASKTQAVPASRREPTVLATTAPSTKALDSEPKLFDNHYKRFYYTVGPGYSQTLGGPNGFVLYSLSASVNAAYRVREDTWIAGGLNYRLFDNYNHFTYTAPSELPRVRTFIREYMTTSRFTIPYLQGTHVGKLGPDQFYSVYGGLLEPMFGGVGAEWLYRPTASRLAIGIDVNEVQQRAFNQDFSFRNYRTFTGHLTAYWDTGWNDVMVRVSVGQYLAKDKGGTLDISRRFQNGVSVGAYATKTNVSSAQFGEGSFDKGIYVQIPFDAIMGRSIGGIANLNWQPLTRDGGAKLARQFPLYDLTDERSPKSLWYQPGADAAKQ